MAALKDRARAGDHGAGAEGRDEPGGLGGGRGRTGAAVLTRRGHGKGCRTLNSPFDELSSNLSLEAKGRADWARHKHGG